MYVRFEQVQLLQQKGYSNITPIGLGAFGFVFRAQKYGVSLAIKAIRQSLDVDLENLAKFEGELKKYFNQSKHICVPFDYFLEEGHHFFVMKVFLSNKKLYTTDLSKIMLKLDHALSEEAAKHIIKHVFQAIVFIHARGIIHRDIKPQNIFVDCDEQLWNQFKNKQIDANSFVVQSKFLLGDFGVPKQLEVYTDTFVGSQEFLAPEIQQQQPFSYPVDLYSLGIVFSQLIKDKYGVSSNVSEDTKQMIKQMTNRDPTARSTKYQIDKYFGIVRIRSFTPNSQGRTSQEQKANHQSVERKKNIKILNAQKILETPIEEMNSEIQVIHRGVDTPQQKKNEQQFKLPQFIPSQTDTIYQEQEVYKANPLQNMLNVETSSLSQDQFRKNNPRSQKRPYEQKT